MSKVLKTAAIVVGAVALAATGVGALGSAGLLGSSIAAGGTIAGIATAATLTTIGTLAGAAAAALSLGSGLTAKKPSATATGSQEQFSADPDAGIPLVIGRTGTAGNIVFRRGFDTRDAGDNDRQAFVANLSLGPVAAIEGMTVDKVPTFFGGTGAAIGAFAGFMWSMTQLGAVPEPSALSFGAGGNPPGWTAQSGLSGLAAASWMLRFDTKAKVFQNGVPAPMWTVRGVLAYDPRKDSTYPGGSGSHRMADPADTAAYDAAVKTWEWTEDPYLMGLRWAHGFWQRDPRVAGSTYQRVMGMGAPWTGIDVAAFVEGANIAKANGWTVGGVIFSGDEKWSTMKKILQAGMGEPLALGARISCLVNAPKVSLATITIDDVIGEASVSATQPRRDRFNTITPRYRLEANNWQLLPGAPISVAAHVAEDRGKRSKVLDYLFIQNTPQVATAARYDIENAREFGPIVLPLKLVWMGYKPGDCVTANLPELGLNNQPILLLNRDLDPSAGTTTMTARSETAAKHPFALGQTATPPSTPGVTGPMLIPVPGDGAWTISGTSIVSGQATVPALIVTGAVDAGSAEAVVIEYRPFGDGQSGDAGWRGAGVFEPTLTRQEIVSVQSGTAYEVAISYQRQGFIGDRRVIGPVITGGTKLDFQAVNGPTKPENNATAGATLGVDVRSVLGDILAPAEVLNSAISLRPDGTLVATIGDTVRPLGTLKLPDLGAASDAARRQLESDLASLAAAVAQLATGQQLVQNVFRDAGLYTDPASGVAKLFAVESRAEQIAKLSVSLNAALALIELKATVNYVDQAILQAKLDGSGVDLSSIFVRLTSAETSINGLQASIMLKADATIVTGLQGSVTNIQQSLDALNAVISSKASQTVVDGLGQRLTLAEQVISAFDGAAVTTSVTAARRAPADLDVDGANSILALLGGYDAKMGALDALATAKTELRALTDGNTGAIAALGVQLGVQIGAVSALVSSEQQARIAGDTATASDLATYKAATNGSLATANASIIAQSDRLSAFGGRLNQYDASLGGLSGRITDEHSAWVAGDQANAQALQSYRSQTDTALSQANTQIGTVAGNLSALSGTVTSLSTTVGGHTASLTTYGQSIDGLRLRWGAEFNDNGVITGFALNGGGGRTDATFLVTSFKIARPNGASTTTVFSIADDGVVEMPNVRVGYLKAKSVTADNIVPGSVLRVSVKVLQAPVAIPWG